MKINFFLSIFLHLKSFADRSSEKFLIADLFSIERFVLIPLVEMFYFKFILQFHSARCHAELACELKSRFACGFTRDPLRILIPSKTEPQSTRNIARSCRCRNTKSRERSARANILACTRSAGSSGRGRR